MLDYLNNIWSFVQERQKQRKEKVCVHKQISFRSFKKYSLNEYENIPVEVIFLNYEKYNNNVVNKTDNDFLTKTFEVVWKL